MDSTYSKRRTALAVIGAAAIVGYLLVLTQRVRDLERQSGEFQHSAVTAVASIDSTLSHARQSIATDLADSLRSASRLVLEEQTEVYDRRIDSVRAALLAATDSLRLARTALSRSVRGLPDSVGLEEVAKAYQGGASFTTPVGTLAFYTTQITVRRVPSTREVAFVRVGKEKSTENAELIKAWLAQGVWAKEKQGYKQIYRHARPAEYGEYTEALYRKGDLYLKTYFQYGRVQGTYGRYSLQYTYYMEVGSQKRHDAATLEEYNAKLGS